MAEELIAELDRGQNFADLAKRESVDTSKQKGGDLGWITPEFAASRAGSKFVDAFTSLRAGEYSRKPVNTPYGWCVVGLEGTRNLP